MNVFIRSSRNPWKKHQTTPTGSRAQVEKHCPEKRTRSLHAHYTLTTALRTPAKAKAKNRT